MSLSDKAANWIIRLRAVSILITWFHLWGPIAGLIVTASGMVWAVMTGVPTPIVLMAAYCTITAAVYLGLAPMAYRVLQRAQESPIRSRPSPEIWRYLPNYKLYEAACLLADSEPDIRAVLTPGDANGLYRTLCEAVISNELERVSTPYDSQHTFIVINERGLATGEREYRPHEETVVTRASLQKFAEKRRLNRAFLLEGLMP